MRFFLKVLFAMKLADSVPNPFNFGIIWLNGTHEQKSFFMIFIVEAEGRSINSYVFRDAIKR